MRKALIPMLVSLALCGAAATAMVISSANAQPGTHNPMMLAAPGGLQLAANDTPSTPPERGRRGQAPGDIAARMKQVCQDQVARESGRLAYLETSLDLTASQQPLFQRWKEAQLGVARRQADQCDQRPLPQRQAAQAPQGQSAQNQTPQTRAVRPSPADRMAREEDRLKQRLADIQAERPSLEAFYNGLSPEQKMTFMRSEMRGRGSMMRRTRFADAMGPRGMMGRPPGPPLQR
ncbi:MAG TPA: Spy/CpxP family protein refolding chaperone [Rhizomicrobium sp.]|jgi:hypothetical protein|nr:Spy/CpxP family protein refolding chaperone [Rhizomicrobium sp.]